MAKARMWETRPTCDRVHIRKNKGGLYPGVYYPKSSTIGLSFNKNYVRDFERYGYSVETYIAQTLLHEVTHWAEYLFLDRADWVMCSRGITGIVHDERIVEKIANEIMATWEW